MSPSARQAGDTTTPDDRLLRHKRRLHQQLIEGLDLSAIGTLSQEELRGEVRQAAEELSHASPDLLSQGDRERLVDEVLDETFGLGPLEPLLRDPDVTDILVNGPRQVYVERDGCLERTAVAFHDERHLLQVVQRVAARVGRRIDETSPMVDARLADGSRVNAIIPPLALDGPLVSIRRFARGSLFLEDMVARGCLTEDMRAFLAACVRARVNMVVSGGTGSGKTTLLNALSAFLSPDERVITIEDAAELRLLQPHVVRMETRPPNIEGQGEVTTRDLVRNALRMRPDRIIVGECRGPEALDMLQAMNTGHEGSLTTIHANETRDALSRLEMMVGMAGFDLPVWIIRRQVAAAIQVVIQTARLAGGARKVVRISEITGMEGDVISMHDLFAFRQTGLDDGGHARGEFRVTGIRPHCLARLETSGIRLAAEMFEPRALDPKAGALDRRPRELDL